MCFPVPHHLLMTSHSDKHNIISTQLSYRDLVFGECLENEFSCFYRTKWLLDESPNPTKSRGCHSRLLIYAVLSCRTYVAHRFFRPLLDILPFSKPGEEVWLLKWFALCLFRRLYLLVESGGVLVLSLHLPHVRTTRWPCSRCH